MFDCKSILPFIEAQRPNLIAGEIGLAPQRAGQASARQPMGVATMSQGPASKSWRHVGGCQKTMGSFGSFTEYGTLYSGDPRRDNDFDNHPCAEC